MLVEINYQETRIGSPFVFDAKRTVGEKELPYGMSIANIDSVRYFPDFRELVEAIHQETGTLLQASLESMDDSFAERKAVALLDGDRAVGYVRYSTLLDNEKKSELGIKEDFPDIYETGTAIILPEYRGHKFYPKLRTALLSLYEEQMREGKVLVLGTTKSPKVIESLDDSVDLGLEIEIIDFLDVMGVSAHTCVCTGKFGNGLQNGEYCAKRATKEDLIQISQHNWEDLRKAGKMIDGKIPCTLYLSSSQLAREMDLELREKFGSLGNLIKALKGVGHYE